MLARPDPRRDRALVEAVAVVAHLEPQRGVVVGELDDHDGRVARVLAAFCIASRQQKYAALSISRG